MKSYEVISPGNGQPAKLEQAVRRGSGPGDIMVLSIKETDSDELAARRRAKAGPDDSTEHPVTALFAPESLRVDKDLGVYYAMGEAAILEFTVQTEEQVNSEQTAASAEGDGKQARLTIYHNVDNEFSDLLDFDIGVTYDDATPESGTEPTGVDDEDSSDPTQKPPQLTIF